MKKKRKPSTPRGRKKADPGIPWGRIVNAVGMVIVAAVVAGVLFYAFNPDAQRTRRAARARPAGTQAAAPATGTQSFPDRQGEPWEHDEETNSHWDPRPDHQHWHPGPPPPPDQRIRLMTQP